MPNINEAKRLPLAEFSDVEHDNMKICFLSQTKGIVNFTLEMYYNKNEKSEVNYIIAHLSDPSSWEKKILISKHDHRRCHRTPSNNKIFMEKTKYI